MGMRKFWSLFNRRLLTIILLLIQVWFLLDLVIRGSLLSQRISEVLTLASILAVLYIVSKKGKGAYKTAWAILILAFPLFGGLFYLLYCLQTSSRYFSHHIGRVQEKAQPLFALPGTAGEEAAARFPEHQTQIRYLQYYAGFPAYANTSARYLSPGESFWEELLAQLEKAEHYIFLEYFIVQEGEMWGKILEILKRKAAGGVLVRVLYDDFGCLLKLPKGYARQLREYGIECCVFNPFRPVLSAMQNNRDHRKIAVIDGKVAFTGGVNLADEYINAVQRFGHWLDAAVVLEGSAAWSLTLIFLQTWTLCSRQEEDYGRYDPWKDEPCPVQAEGYVQPYADSPLDDENVGEHVYQQILNTARDYVYINTPYLIIDDSTVSALCLAAKSGVDVRIVAPHKADNWFVHMTTRSYYRDLIRGGVKVYEYTPGFIHSKTFVSDDSVAVVGSTNMDFRSLYLHFECGALLLGSSAVMEVKEDFLRTLESCQPIRYEDCRGNIFLRLLQDVLRLFAPLM